MGSRWKLNEKSYTSCVAEERRALDGRVKVDRIVGAWAAGKLGLEGTEAEKYVDGIVLKGMRSGDGRGGFDAILADLVGHDVGPEELRHRYFMAASGTYLGRSAAVGHPSHMA